MGEHEHLWDDLYVANLSRLSITDLLTSLKSQVKASTFIFEDLEEYLGPKAQMPALINPAWIKGHLAQTTVSIGCDKVKVWATVDLAKVCLLDTNSDIHTNTCPQ
jgi:hypothetical protein